ncbi:MAG: ATP-binding protein [Polyangiaceae bacterium]
MSAQADGVKVLLVEDSVDDADLAELALRRGGLALQHVERVDTPEALRRALRTAGWDVVLSDYNLPSFSGKVALEIVQAHGVDVPFIVVSGSLGEDLAVEMMKAGAHDFFAKGRLTLLAPAVVREIREATRRRDAARDRERADAERLRLLGELREAVRARDTFLALAAHELRTPLTSALLKLDRMRRLAREAGGLDPAELQSGLTLVALQQRRLAALVDNLMEVAWITSGTRPVPLVRVALDLGCEVEDALTSLRDPIEASGSSITSDLAPGVVGQWDATRIRSLLRNLLSNAVKFGRGMPVAVTVSAAGGLGRLVVEDHGAGIGSEDQERIFNKFEHVVTEHHQAGFGLGLWIARRVVDDHGGRMEVASRPGSGSTFTVELPLGRPEPAAPG